MGALVEALRFLENMIKSSIESISVSLVNSDISPFTIIYLGGGKVALHRGYVIQPFDLKKIEVTINETALKHAWLDTDLPYIELPPVGGGVTLILKHSDKSSISKSEFCLIESAEIKTTEDAEADKEEPGYDNTHTTIEIAKIKIDEETDVITNYDDMQIVQTNIFAMIPGTK